MSSIVTVQCEGKPDSRGYCFVCLQHIETTGSSHSRTLPVLEVAHKTMPMFEARKLSSLFLGVTGRLDEDLLLLEIDQYGYRGYYLNKPEVKVQPQGVIFIIGDGEEIPPRWHREQFPNRHWRRIR